MRGFLIILVATVGVSLPLQAEMFSGHAKGNARSRTSQATVTPRPEIQSSTRSTVPQGPFRARRPAGLSSRSNYSVTTSNPNFRTVFRQARTPAQASTRGSNPTADLWGGIDPSLLTGQSFVPPAITSNASASQSEADFAAAIAALTQGEDNSNSLALSLLNQAVPSVNNQLDPNNSNAGGGSGSGGASGGGAGGGASAGNPAHAKALKDLEDLRRQQQLRDALAQNEIDNLRNRINELQNPPGGGDGGNGGPGFGPDGSADIVPGEGGFIPDTGQKDWSDAPDGKFDIGAVPDGKSSGPVGDLIGANTNGNPGFQYQTALGRGSMAGCQGALVFADKGYCVMATAAHCLDDSIHMASNRARDSELGGFSGEVTFRTKDFGQIKAQAFMNAEYAVDSWQDSGAVVFRCDEETASKMTVFDIETNVGGEESVQYGKVMGGKEGYYRGTTVEKYGTYSVPNNRPYEQTSIAVDQEGTSIQQGDSGGPLVNSAGKLVGVLSTLDPRTGQSSYAAKQSMEFIKKVVAKVKTSAESEYKQREEEENRKKKEEELRIAREKAAEREKAEPKEPPATDRELTEDET